MGAIRSCSAHLGSYTKEESPSMPAVLRSSLGPGPEIDGKVKCEKDVLSCFPDICPDYLRSQAAEHQWDSQGLITRLLDDLEKDQPYPKRPTVLKRKRPEKIEKDSEEEMRWGFEEDPRLASKGQEYFKLYTKKANALLKAAFQRRYAEDIENTLKANNFQLYTTYLALDKASWSPDAGPIKLKRAYFRRPNPNAEKVLRYGAVHQGEIDAIAAFDAARAACTAKAQEREAKEAQEKQKVQEEEETLQRAKAEGTVADCGCCYEELALSSMIHCDGDTTHWFCRSCAKQMAEHVVGLSKYRLGCMSVDGCDATFSRDQKELFLDDKLTNALELIEQEEVLRLAGIENLESCPFCPYAAEYPPVEENKEFRCENPDCLLISCRLCRQETHIPKACEEAARERGHSARRVIEEAMSAALIRKCNKCGTPFIKENGCNKMTCTRSGCRNVQCYVCSKSCDYNHFDDASRGGKKGNCPLFDNVEDRHKNEVHTAEALARQQVAEENPEVGDELLHINFSERVKEDDARRTAGNPRPPGPPGFRHMVMPVPAFIPVDPGL
ncbi:uncharacterized protein B0H64DRAFT_183856 [Chaetomium fimeti]|uniref:RING-type domain-containing protein n=1 Tax=Chaetomium fimeti TaxID=1854472 RepID=A0AAE0LR74_9PEZI|nr:hypothetical protein B0H64DRAFT_183856 [Chaetomium fimeti]